MDLDDVQTILVTNQTLGFLPTSNMSVVDPSTTFAGLCDSVGLDLRLRKAVSRLGHVRPTLVQSKCLPLAIADGRDLLVRAKTGSGKTLSYGLPLLHKLLRNKKRRGIEAIVLVPTRELCAQVHLVLQNLTYYCDEVITLAVLNAGKNEQAQLARQEALLRDLPKVLVATPGGLLTQIRKNNVDLKMVETLVVDEADLVLSFGYSNDIAEIVKALPRIYQGFLMSATLSPEVDSLKKVVLNSPVVLKLEMEESKAGAGKLKQFFLSLPKKDKNLVIYVFLKLGLLKGKGLFFVNTTDAGYRLKLFLEQFHIRSAVLNSELPFTSRINVIEQFNVGNFDYLIATDTSADASTEDEPADEKVTTEEQSSKSKRKKDAEYGVSRGLDFRNVSFVLNVDFPPNRKSYAHRIGRTARGGASGVALSLIDAASHTENEVLLAIQEVQPRVSLAATTADKLQGATGTDESPDDQPQPMPLDFDLREIEGFRYRVEDVSRAVTKIAVREARASELKAEILNSERLQSHFEDNPVDLQLLRHDRVATKTSRVQEHLKHVPKYLLPRGMQVANLNRKKRKKRSKMTTGGASRADNDPLRAFDDQVDMEGVAMDEDDFDELMDDGEEEEAGRSNKKQKIDDEDRKVFSNTKDGTGYSTAGRQAWKEKHRKGKFKGKKSKGKKGSQPLGI